MTRIQKVVIEGGLTYAWEGDESLAVGDTVLVPPTYWQESARTATVVQIGSDYSGYLVNVIRKVAP